MKPSRFFPKRGYALAVITMAMALVVGCSSYARSTAVVAKSTPAANPVEEYKADEFVGVPIVGDYDDDRNLDFILEVADKDRTFKIKVHEDYGETNGEVLDKIRLKINEAVDRDRVRIIGYYNPEYKGPEKEYGFMDLKTIVFYDDKSGYEEAYFTDDKDSRFYKDADVTVIYAPGHHYRNVYYPRYCTPWWDSDGDRIPDAYDPWPGSYDVWYDYNLNGVPDWYDPYYCSVYPYWHHWDMGFWISYDWYGPSYFRSYRHHPGLYYDDYLTYSRLYDHRMQGRDWQDYRLDPRVSNRSNDYDKNMDPKRQWRNDQIYGGGSTTAAVRGTSVSGGEADRYERLAVDRRRYAPVIGSGGDVAYTDRNGTLSSGGGTAANTGSADRTFTRNRELNSTPNTGTSTRSRNTGSTYDTPDLSKTKDTGSDTRETPGGGRLRDSAPTRTTSSPDSRVYVPSSRERVVGGESSGSGTVSGAATTGNSTSRGVTNRERTVSGTTTGSASGRVTSPSNYSTTPSSTTRSRSTTDSRYRGSYVTSRSSGGYTTPSSSGSSGSSAPSGSTYSAPSRERSSGGSYTPSSGSGRSGSSAPASSRPAASSGGSRPAPAAAQPSGGSRSRDSGSSSSGSSGGSRGGDRGRR